MIRVAVVALTLSLVLPVYSMADSNEDALYLHRSRMMEAASSHLKALQAYVKGELTIQAYVPAHVEALLELNNMIKDLFPADYHHPESEALPAIWSDPRGFQFAIQNNHNKIMKLKQVDPGDLVAMKRAVNEVRMSCGDCHSYFRER